MGGGTGRGEVAEEKRKRRMNRKRGQSCDGIGLGMREPGGNHENRQRQRPAMFGGLGKDWREQTSKDSGLGKTATRTRRLGARISSKTKRPQANLSVSLD